jgi:hypothetical protein
VQRVAPKTKPKPGRTTPATQKPTPKAKTPSGGGESAKVQENVKKWGRELIEAGWTLVPNVFLKGQRALGLSTTDLVILIQLMRHWWSRDNPPYVGKKALADAMGLEARHIRRRLNALQQNGLIASQRRKGPRGGDATSAYTFDGLIAKARPLALQELREIETRRQKKRERLRKLPVPT